MSTQLAQAAAEIRRHFQKYNCEVSERIPDRLSIHLRSFLGFIAIVPEGFSAYVSDGSKDMIRGISEQCEVDVTLPTLSEALTVFTGTIDRLLNVNEEA